MRRLVVLVAVAVSALLTSSSSVVVCAESCTYTGYYLLDSRLVRTVGWSRLMGLVRSLPDKGDAKMADWLERQVAAIRYDAEASYLSLRMTSEKEGSLGLVEVLSHADGSGRETVAGGTFSAAVSLSAGIRRVAVEAANGKRASYSMEKTGSSLILVLEEASRGQLPSLEKYGSPLLFLVTAPPKADSGYPLYK